MDGAPAHRQIDAVDSDEALELLRQAGRFKNDVAGHAPCILLFSAANLPAGPLATCPLATGRAICHVGSRPVNVFVEQLFLRAGRRW
jgi:hypothetical protein